MAVNTFLLVPCAKTLEWCWEIRSYQINWSLLSLGVGDFMVEKKDKIQCKICNKSKIKMQTNVKEKKYPLGY